MHDTILCMMQYYTWCNIMHDAILCMMQYYAWYNIMNDAILCMMLYYAWSNIFHNAESQENLRITHGGFLKNVGDDLQGPNFQFVTMYVGRSVGLFLYNEFSKVETNAMWQMQSNATWQMHSDKCTLTKAI